MAIEVCSLVDTGAHIPGLQYDNYWQQCLVNVHNNAAGAAQQINYHQLDITPPTGALQGSNAISKARRRQFTQCYGTAVQNHVTAGNPAPDVLLWRGHGALINHVTNRFLADDRSPLPPTAWVGQARLYYAHTGMGVAAAVPRALISGKDISNATDFPVMPTTLWFSESCFGAWEVSFASHVIRRGCPFFIGSRRSWTGGIAFGFLEALMDDWRQRNNYDPTQLEAAFRAVAPNRRAACPVFYRRAGGVSSPLGQLHPLSDYKMIHAAPNGAYRFGKVEVHSTAGERVAVELL